MHGIWRGLPQSEKDKYKPAAEAESERRKRDAEIGFTAAFGQSVGNKQKRGLQRHMALQRTLRTIRLHPLWRSGLQLSSHEAALKPDLVRVDQPYTQIKRELDSFFAYDTDPTPNPRGVLSNKRVCHIECNGCCMKDLEDKVEARRV